MVNSWDGYAGAYCLNISSACMPLAGDTSREMHRGPVIKGLGCFKLVSEFCAVTEYF